MIWARLLVAAVLFFLPASLLADVRITGETRTLTSASWPQYHPKISGDYVVFQEWREGHETVAYVNIATDEYVQVTQPGDDSILQRIDDGRIVYVDFAFEERDVFLYEIDTAEHTLLTEHHGFMSFPDIYGDLVVYEFWLDPAYPRDIWAVDLTTMFEFPFYRRSETYDTRPAIHGMNVVFERAETLGGDAWIVLLDAETRKQVAIAPELGGNQRWPAIYGDRVVFDADPEGDGNGDIFIYDISTGDLERIDLPGRQWLAQISGDVIAFDSQEMDGTWNVYLYHVPSGHLHAVTDASTQDYLNDIDGNRLVYTSFNGTEQNIYLYTFTLEDAPVAEMPEDACVCEVPLTPVFAEQFTRGAGQPEHPTRTFSAPPGEGFVVVQSASCNAAPAVIELNGEWVMPPKPMVAAGDHSGCEWAPLELAAENELEVSLFGGPGCLLNVTIYSLEPLGD